MIIIPRLARKDLNATFFHVIVQGHKKEFIFKKNRYIYQYMNLIRKYLKETNLKIISYCIMNNHAHFLFQVEEIQELSNFFHKLNTMYARYYNYMEQDRVGYVFRERFLSEPITSHRYLVQCIKYIHFNPVKARIVNKCEDYKFSSYNYFVNRLKKESFINFLNKEDYEEICNNVNYNINFLDIEKNIEENILVAIYEFININKIQLSDIFCNRDILEKVIFYLKNYKNINYVDIQSFFEMSRGTMQTFMIKNKK